MNNQRSKKIVVIVIVVILLLAALAVGGYFAYAYTDLFKSNETLFYKYAAQSIDSLKFKEDSLIKSISEATEQSPYEITGDLSYRIENDGSEYEIAKVDMQIVGNKPDDEAYSKFDITSNRQKLLTFEYAHSNDIYAVKYGDLNAFIGIKNDNLKVLAQKFGIHDTSEIPDKIEASTAKDITLSEDEIEYLQTTYLEVLRKNIDKDKFTKEPDSIVVKDGKSYKTTGYRLKLSVEEIRQITVAILNTMLEDSRTLNMIATRAKSLDMGEEFTDIDNLTNSIQDAIDTINENTETGEGIVIMLYVDGGKVINSEIILSNEIKITAYGSSEGNTSKRHVLVESLNVNAEVGNIEINEEDTRGQNESSINISIKTDSNTSIDAEIVNTGNVSTGVNTTGEISLSAKNNGETIVQKIKYNQDLEIKDSASKIVKLSSSNCGILNDYSVDVLQQFVPQILQYTSNLITQKMRLIGYTPISEDNSRSSNSSQIIQNDVEDVISNSMDDISRSEVETFNAKFSSYQGQISGTMLKALKTVVETSNISNMENQVTLVIDGQRSFGDNVEIKTGGNYNVKLVYSDEGFVNQIIATSM